MTTAPARPVSRWHRADGVPVHSTRQGVGADEVVLVPGLGMSGRTLRPLAGALASWSRVRVVDLPGTGPVPHRRRDPSVEDLATTLVAWLAAAAPGRPTLVGISLGCQVVVEAARRAPGAVAGVVLVSPPFDRRARNPVHQVLRLLRTLPRERPGLLALLTLEWLRAGPRRVARLARAGADHPLERRVHDLAVPLLVVRGDADPVASPFWADEVARATPRGQVAVIGGAGHGVHWRAPRRLADAVRRFAGAGG